MKFKKQNKGSHSRVKCTDGSVVDLQSLTIKGSIPS